MKILVDKVYIFQKSYEYSQFNKASQIVYRDYNDSMKQARNSEVDAYIWIKETLESLRWNIKNPSRNADGSVYTQNECQSHPEIKQQLGRLTPENIVKISENKFWVIESKKEHKQLQQALDEAKHDYAEKINQSRSIKAIFASGVAGNRTDSYYVETQYFNGNKWENVTINGKKATSLLSPEDVRIILSQNSAEIKDIVIDKKLFLKKAEKINEILHLGAINKNYRARVIAAILLSLLDETQPNVEAAPIVLIDDINSRVKNILRKEGKENFARLIEIEPPPSTDNHIKFKKALVDTIQELNILNIRSAMNSGTDVLGEFYEVFLKYGNGAKEIGIVLTPRHITQYAVDVLDITPNDIIFDPTCGTGGFLVAAFDYVKKQANQRQIDKFKQKNIFGIDQEAPVVALAIVNMIFRGDGKNNIIEGNCFQKNLIADRDTAKYTNEYKENEQAVTKVLMNPPFALKNSDEKEYKFIDYALRQMQDGGILFSVLPYSAMSKSSSYDEWRKKMIQHNTLLSVVTFPEDLFYPVGVFTVGVFLKKGIPHPKEQKVLWVRAITDGHTKKKGRRLMPDMPIEDFLSESKDFIRSFISNPNIKIESRPKLIKESLIDWSDPRLELVPEVYLDDNEITKERIEKEMRFLIKEVAAFKIKFCDNLNL